MKNLWSKKMDKISHKALRLLQNIFSLKEINKIILPLNKERQPEEEYGYFAIEDYYPIIYEESILLIIEIAVLMRREAEQLDKYNESLNAKVKYSNVSKDIQNVKDISFVDTLSKIVHSDDILLEVKDRNGNIGYSYELDRDCYFTGFALCKGTDKNNTPQTIKIDIKRFCINVFMFNADRCDMI